MDLDFYWRYKDATDEELLEVFQQPERYQPALVEVVKRILAERGMVVAVDEMPADGIRDLLTDDWQETKPPAWITVVLMVATIQSLLRVTCF